MKTPKNKCWCCGDDLQQLHLLDDKPACEECVTAAREGETVEQDHQRYRNVMEAEYGDAV